MFPFLSRTYFIHFIWLPKYIKLLVFIQVATGQIASTGMALLSYVQKVSDKVSQSWHIKFVLSIVLFNSYIEFSLQVSLATDLMCNFNSMSRDVTASFGYDYILRQVLSTTYLVMTTSLADFKRFHNFYTYCFILNDTWYYTMWISRKKLTHVSLWKLIRITVGHFKFFNFAHCDESLTHFIQLKNHLILFQHLVLVIIVPP